MAKQPGTKKKLTEAQRDKLKEKIPKRMGIYLDETKDYESYYFKYRLPGHKSSSTDRGHASVEAALLAKSELLKQAKSGTYVVPSKQTLVEYFEWFMILKWPKIRKPTRSTYKTALRLYQRLPIGKIPITQITSFHLEESIAQLLEEGMKLSSIRSRFLKHINTSFNYAVKHKILTENPVTFVEIARPDEEEEDDVSIVTDFTPELAANFLEFVKDTKHKNLTDVYFYSGARRGEGLGLREVDVDFENDLVSFNWSVVEDENGRPHIQKSLKTKSSKRTITLDKPAMKALKNQLKIKAAYKMAAGSSFVDHGLIFCNPDGSPHHPSVISAFYRRQFKNFGKPKMTLHKIRHWVTTSLLAAGIDPLTVQKRMGHSDLSMTMKIYGHLQREKDKLSAAAIGNVIQNRSIG